MKAEVYAYYAGKPGRKTDVQAAADLGVSPGAFGNARRELERDGLLTIVRVPQPQGGGHDRVLVKVLAPKSFSEPRHFRVYEVLADRGLV